MRIFLAGATGAIGRQLVPRLLAAGHEVVALTRDTQKAAGLTAQGARGVVTDVQDAAAVAAAMVQTRPDVVINELTDLGRSGEGKRIQFFWEANDRLQILGTQNLLAAARAAGVKRFIEQSSAYWYAPQNEGLHQETDALFVEAPPPVGDAVRAVERCERLVLDEGGMEGIVLRYGLFYGPGTWYARDGEIGRRIRDRAYPSVGSGKGVFSFIHVEDAASATVHFVSGGRPGIYNVVDDEPATRDTWLPVFVQALGAPAPLVLPPFVVKLPTEKAILGWAAGMKGASNAKLKQEVGWAPRYGSWRRGFAEALG